MDDIEEAEPLLGGGVTKLKSIPFKNLFNFKPFKRKKNINTVAFLEHKQRVKDDNKFNWNRMPFIDDNQFSWWSKFYNSMNPVSSIQAKI